MNNVSIYDILTRKILINHSLRLANIANLVHNFSYYVYFFSLHVSADHVPIIRRNNCIYATIGTCYSVWMTVWYAERKEINILRKIVHQVVFIYNFIQGYTVNKT
jgi:hypothetical protein